MSKARTPSEARADVRLRKKDRGLVQRPPRRTQAERLAETRARIIAATVDYIDEEGFHQASLARVAQKAHVTVGAVQHHFSSKNDLLSAVVEDSFLQLAATGNSFEAIGGSLEQRVNGFIDISWDFCNSARYQAGLQILRGMREETWGDYESWLEATLGGVMKRGFESWRRLLSDVVMDEAEFSELLLFMFSSLSGSAQLYRISQDTAQVKSDLRQLKALLLLRLRSATLKARKRS